MREEEVDLELLNYTVVSCKSNGNRSKWRESHGMAQERGSKKFNCNKFLYRI